jgi:hypothetical protein
MRLSTWIGVIVFCVIFSGAAWAVTDQSQGAAELQINGGRTGNILFKHRLHQETLKTCAPCHDHFPQKSGSIEQMKTTGKLKKKEVMNHVCLKCHRDRKKKHLSAGPTVKCSECHVR